MKEKFQVLSSDISFTFYIIPESLAEKSKKDNFSFLSGNFTE